MPDFLTIQDALEIHAHQIDKYGGDPDVRDLPLLESALAQPMAAFGGEFLHGDLFVMAAAYLFHIVKNHPLVDGNKRAGAATAVTFLKLNGVEFVPPQGTLYDITIAAATGQMQKPQIADALRQHASSR